MTSRYDIADHAANLNRRVEIGPDKLVEAFNAHLLACFNLCCTLEQLADDLPDGLSKAAAGDLIQAAQNVLTETHSFEEEVLHPALLRFYPGDAELEQTLARLAEEHVEDRAFAEELEDCAKTFVSAPNAGDANRLGYMLRGFFEAMRRHIAFEREHLLPKLIAAADARA